MMFIQYLAVFSLAVADLSSARQGGQCGMKFSPYREGYCFRSSVCPGAVFRSLCQHESEDIGCCILEYSPSYRSFESNVTLEMFKEVFGDTTRSHALYIHFSRSLDVAKVSSCQQQSAFMAQIAFDTSFLSTMEKTPSEEEMKSEEKLKYIGRGAIHVSGRKFYAWLQRKIKRNIIDMPEVLAFPSLSFLSAATTWSHSYSSTMDGPLSTTSFNKLADGSRYGFLLLSYYLRGHIENVDKLLKIWAQVNKALHCECKDDDGPQCIVDGHRGKCKLTNECLGRQFESTNQCMGPGDAVRCSLGRLGSKSPIKIDVYVERRKSWSHPDMLQNIVKMVQDSLDKSEGEISWKTFSMDNFSLEGGWNKKMRSLALFVHECADGISFAMQKALKNGKNQSSGLVFLGIMENRTVDWRFGHFDKKITINETKLGEKLLENIYSGPWLLPLNKQMQYKLDRFETNLLAVEVQNGGDLVSTIFVNITKGDMIVEGMQNFNRLPWYQKNYCNGNPFNKTAKDEDTHSMQQIIVQYRSPFSNEQTDKMVKAIVVNSKAIVILRSTKIANTATIKVSVRRKLLTSNQLQGSKRSMTVMISSLTVIASCSMAIIFICAIIRSIKSDLGPTSRLSEDDDMSVAIRSRTEQHDSSPNLLGAVYKTQDKSDKDLQDSGGKAAGNHNIRCFVLLKHIEVFKLACVFLFSLSTLLSRLVGRSTISIILIQYTLRYCSNMVYEFLIIGIKFGSDSWLQKLLACKKRSNVLLYILLFGVPALLSSFPSILWLTVGQSWNWMKINALVELATKSLLFTVAATLSLTRFVKQMTREDGNNFWLKDIICLLFNLLFTSVWFFCAFEVHLNHFGWFTEICAALDFILAVFICTSVYWQTKQSLLQVKRGNIWNREREAGEEK